MGLNDFFDSNLVLVKALCINLENENHSPGGHARRSLKKLYFLASFGQFGDNFEAFVDVPVKQVLFHDFEKTTNTSEFRHKRVQNRCFWTRIFDKICSAVMAFRKFRKMAKSLSGGARAPRLEKKYIFFQIINNLRNFCRFWSKLKYTVYLFLFKLAPNR